MVSSSLSSKLLSILTVESRVVESTVRRTECVSSSSCDWVVLTTRWFETLLSQFAGISCSAVKSEPRAVISASPSLSEAAATDSWSPSTSYSSSADANSTSSWVKTLSKSKFNVVSRPFYRQTSTNQDKRGIKRKVSQRRTILFAISSFPLPLRNCARSRVLRGRSHILYSVIDLYSCMWTACMYEQRISIPKHIINYIDCLHLL